MDQADVFRHVLGALEALNVRYMVVGSFASTAYGEPRFTQDIDIVVDMAEADVVEFCEAFPGPDFYIEPSAVLAAVRYRFLFKVLHAASGNKVDFILPKGDLWSASQLDRRQRTRIFPDLDGYAACPEDVILGKLWYYAEGGSEKHLRDIAGILRVSRDAVNCTQIEYWAAKMNLGAVWQAVLARCASP